MNMLYIEDDMEEDARKGLRVIKTARTLEAINQRVRDGYLPLIQKVSPGSRIKVSILLKRDKETGNYKVEHNGWGRSISIKRQCSPGERVYEYYPYTFPSPFAAYLVPQDIELGEKVVLEDLIEDCMGRRYKSDQYRREDAEATWDGEKFVIKTTFDFLDHVLG
jgi:hypothetical protein